MLSWNRQVDHNINTYFNSKAHLPKGSPKFSLMNLKSPPQILNANIEIRIEKCFCWFNIMPPPFLFASDVALIKGHHHRQKCSIAFKALSKVSHKMLYDMQILFVHTLRPYLNILIHLIHRSHSAMEAMLINRPLNTYNTEKETLQYSKEMEQLAQTTDR